MDRDHLSPAPRMPLLTRLKLNRNSQVRSSYRTEATLARSRGAKWGANDRRHWAVPGHNQCPVSGSGAACRRPLSTTSPGQDVGAPPATSCNRPPAASSAGERKAPAGTGPNAVPGPGNRAPLATQATPPTGQRQPRPAPATCQRRGDVARETPELGGSSDRHQPGGAYANGRRCR